MLCWLFYRFYSALLVAQSSCGSTGLYSILKAVQRSTSSTGLIVFPGVIQVFSKVLYYRFYRAVHWFCDTYVCVCVCVGGGGGGVYPYYAQYCSKVEVIWVMSHRWYWQSDAVRIVRQARKTLTCLFVWYTLTHKASRLSLSTVTGIVTVAVMGLSLGNVVVPICPTVVLLPKIACSWSWSLVTASDYV